GVPPLRAADGPGGPPGLPPGRADAVPAGAGRAPAPGGLRRLRGPGPRRPPGAPGVRAPDRPPAGRAGAPVVAVPPHPNPPPSRGRGNSRYPSVPMPTGAAAPTGELMARALREAGGGPIFTLNG